MWAFVAKRDFLLLEEEIKNDPSMASKYARFYNAATKLQDC